MPWQVLAQIPVDDPIVKDAGVQIFILFFNFFGPHHPGNPIEREFYTNDKKIYDDGGHIETNKKHWKGSEFI